ncbi:MAG TPA: Crp/Fnr family transcriptional regulator [Thermoanaerobaculia bacterium]|nr:Crp/Fnr family transcriptional regulator [Thermoanaerobaculia bacterium]
MTTTMPPARGPSGNALLNSFPAEVRQRLDIKEERHSSYDVLFKADELPQWAHFPHRGTVISLTRTTEAGTTVEVGIVGFEGVAAVQSLLLPQPAGSEAVVQVPGDVSRVKLEMLRTVMNEDAPVRTGLLAFAGQFLDQVSQHATCNRVHSIEQRLAKWLLAVRDRIEKDEVELTHDFLAHMLGTRRAGVTVAVGALTLDGIVKQHRGGVRIMDREGLELRSCECYRALP